jgi:hypothetical protein
MSANPANAASPDLPSVGVDIQDVLESYSKMLAEATQRYIIAEAGLSAAQRELAEHRARAMQAEPSPTVQENTP